MSRTTAGEHARLAMQKNKVTSHPMNKVESTLTFIDIKTKHALTHLVLFHMLKQNLKKAIILTIQIKK